MENERFIFLLDIKQHSQIWTKIYCENNSNTITYDMLKFNYGLTISLQDWKNNKIRYIFDSNEQLIYFLLKYL